MWLQTGMYYATSCVKENSMATGSRGEKRPSAVIGGAIMVARIATEDAAEELRQRSGRVRSGQAGAKARAEKITAEERSAVARKAAGARWG
jgi:hypothetical protein